MRWPYLIALSLLAVPALACSCASYEPVKACQILSSFPVVFRGQAIDHNDDGSGRFAQMTLYRFEVKEIFKGLPAGTKVVFLDPSSMTSCYGGFQLGKDYLIYASGSGSRSALPTGAAATTIGPREATQKPFPKAWAGMENSPVFVSGGSCSPSRTVAATGDPDLEFLRQARDGTAPKMGWVEGRAVQNSDWPYKTRDFPPAVDAVLTLTSSDGTNRTVRVQPDGGFRFDGVPPGQFQLIAKSPTMGTGKSLGLDRAVMPAVGCSQVNFSFESGVTISGVVLNADSKPAPDVRVELGELLPEGRVRRLPMTWADTDVQGRFQAKNAPAGARTVLAANLNGAPSVSTPFDTVYAPGAQQLTNARIFQPKAGEKIAGVTLQLPPALPMGDLFVDVVWPDGTPALGARAFADWNNARAAFVPAPAGSNRVKLRLALGRAYTVRVDWFALHTPFVEGAAPITVEFKQSGQTVTLKLASAKP